MNATVLFIIIGFYYAYVVSNYFKESKMLIKNLLTKKNMNKADTMYNLVLEKITNQNEFHIVKKNNYLSIDENKLSKFGIMCYIVIPLTCFAAGWLIMGILSGLIGAIMESAGNTVDWIENLESINIFCLVIACIYLIFSAEKITRRFKKSLRIYEFYCEKL